MQDIRSNPLTASNPQANYEATKRFYEALDVPNVEELLKSPEPPDLSPEEENAGFLNEQPATVLPNQEHGHHRRVHQEFMESSFGEKLTPVGKRLAEGHSREHLAQLYLQQAEQGQAQGPTFNDLFGQGEGVF